MRYQFHFKAKPPAASHSGVLRVVPYFVAAYFLHAVFSCFALKRLLYGKSIGRKQGGANRPKMHRAKRGDGGDAQP
jgi:hypothetical protein